MTRAALTLLLMAPVCGAWAAAPVPSASADRNSASGILDAAREAVHVLAVADAHEAAWERYQAAHDRPGRGDNGLCR